MIKFFVHEESNQRRISITTLQMWKISKHLGLKQINTQRKLTNI